MAGLPGRVPNIPCQTGPFATTVDGVPTSNWKVVPLSMYTESDTAQKMIAGQGSHVLRNQRSLGQIAADIKLFRCARAIWLRNNLPSAYKINGFVLLMRVRACLERGEYHPSERESLQTFQLEPSHVEIFAECY